MKCLRRLAIAFAINAALAVLITAQESIPAGASVSGRVTLAGKPVQGITVTATEQGHALRFDRRKTAKATTDSEGVYRIAGLTAGHYEINPAAPAFVSESEKSVTLAEGEDVAGIDFALTKGGVITGRVTNAEGRPVVLETINLTPFEESEEKHLSGLPHQSEVLTDDRGIYRAFGVPPGRYRVSVGGPNGISSMMGLIIRRPVNAQTFHPGVTDATKAAIIDVGPGVEVTNVDISLGLSKRTYVVTGRVLDGDTGKPVANAIPMYTSVGTDVTAFQPGLAPPTSSAGEFRFEGVSPGHYAATAFFGLGSANDLYSERTSFEVANGDVAGIEIKVRRGGSISGFVLVDGTPDPSHLAKLPEVQIGITPEVNATGEDDDDSGLFDVDFGRSPVGPDGSFHIRGLRPGKKRLHINSFTSRTGFTLLRVERSGVPQPDGIEVGSGQHVADVRVIVEYGSAVVRGEVKIESGEVPKGAYLSIKARRKDAAAESAVSDGFKYVRVDANGVFVIEGLLPGEYDLELSVDGVSRIDPSPVLARQTIRAVQGSETRVVLLADLRNRN